MSAYSQSLGSSVSVLLSVLYCKSLITGYCTYQQSIWEGMEKQEFLAGIPFLPSAKGNAPQCSCFTRICSCNLMSISSLSTFFSPIEIVDGNVKMTLGMIWTIILRFAIQDISVEGKF